MTFLKMVSFSRAITQFLKLGGINNYCSSSLNYQRTFLTSSARCKIFTVQDEADFKEKVINSDLPVVIDFQASWCGPCKILEPRLETIIGKHEGKVNLAKVDIDTQTELAMQYNVEAVPFVLGFKNGKPKESFMGVQDDDQIESFVKKLIG